LRYLVAAIAKPVARARAYGEPGTGAEPEAPTAYTELDSTHDHVKVFDLARMAVPGWHMRAGLQVNVELEQFARGFGPTAADDDPLAAGGIL
jgi:hypothetical protein